MGQPIDAPIFFEGRQVAVFGIYRDVSERKRKERLLEALNQTALAMQRALSHERIIEVVPGPYVTLSITDTGHEIPEEILAR